MNVLLKLCDICHRNIIKDDDSWVGDDNAPLLETLSISLSKKFDTPRIGLILILDDSTGEKDTLGNEVGLQATLCTLCYDSIAEKIASLSQDREDTWELASVNFP